MDQTSNAYVNPNRTLSIVLGGGQGTRLFPLTQERSKPAVPLAGKYRLVDIPISNCINAGLKRIYLLTQFNSVSLHSHISQSFKFDNFSKGFVEILAAEQTPTSASWYEGTADAVRKNLVHLADHDYDYVLILSGDQLYRMDFSAILSQHVKNEADITVATIPVVRKDAAGFGIMHMDEERRITRFVEKPKDKEVQDSLALPRDWYEKLGINSDEELFLASMGIYVFNKKTLIHLLDDDSPDFGKHIIPGAIDTHRVFSYIYQGYWEDIGEVKAFFEANLDLATDKPKFDFFDMEAPIYTQARFLPASKVESAEVNQAIISDGCIINGAKINRCIVGIRSYISPGCSLNDVILMGADKFETDKDLARNEKIGRPRIGIGKNTRIERAIIDKNARIGEDCVISPEGKPDNSDHSLYHIRDGIVIIPKGKVIPNGTII